MSEPAVDVTVGCLLAPSARLSDDWGGGPGDGPTPLQSGHLGPQQCPHSEAIHATMVPMVGQKRQRGKWVRTFTSISRKQSQWSWTPLSTRSAQLAHFALSRHLLLG